ncbi:MAG: hypothetical protein HPY65_14385 [Syntrophaceae bacterium]|nr:hypothetical protein [Syntrophaceae bacterium]
MRSTCPVSAIMLLALLGLLAGCAQVRVGTIPPPAPTAKLRVYVQPVTVHPSGTGTRGHFNKSQEEFSQATFRRVQKILNETGIYEVAPWPQVRAVLGDQEIAPHRWRQNDWELARKVGRALHADYVLITERGYAGMKYWQMILFNLQSGKKFEFMDHAAQLVKGDFRQIVRQSFQKIFTQAKGDMLAVAVRKGRLAPVEPLPREPARVAPPTDEEPPEEPEALEPEPEISGKPRVVVYDLDTTERLRVASLIVTEALREEFHRSGRFTIVNRQDLKRAMDEMKLGESGLLEEGKALRLGKWLAANQSVSGRLAPLGNLLVLQARRTDLETAGIMAAASLRCREGQEEDLLAGLPELVQNLSGK